jgi:hypothetical protein
MSDILIYKKETDPSTLLHFQLTVITQTTKNLFLSLAESIAQTLNVTSCYVCGGINMREQWPWEMKELNPESPLMKPFPQPRGQHLAPKNLYYWELLYLLSKRPILHPGRGLDLFGTKVLQWFLSGDSVVGGS